MRKKQTLAKPRNRMRAIERRKTLKQNAKDFKLG